MRTLIVLGLVVAGMVIGGCAKNNEPQAEEPVVVPQPELEPVGGPPEEYGAYPPINDTVLPPPPRGASPLPAPPAPAPPVPAGLRTHTVQPGETLWRISGMYYGRSSQANVQKIMAANPSIVNENDIQAGQRIAIPD